MDADYDRWLDELDSRLTDDDTTITVSMLEEARQFAVDHPKISHTHKQIIDLKYEMSDAIKVGDHELQKLILDKLNQLKSNEMVDTQ